MGIRGLQLLLIVLAVLVSNNVQGQTLGQTDDFEMGLGDWREGPNSRNPPVVIPSGGPTGLNDAFMRATSDGMGGAGGRQVVFNRSQWSGDFTAAGITSVSVDIFNENNGPMSVRLGLAQAINNNRFVTPAQVVPADQQWHTVTFDVSDGAMINVQGSLSQADVLADVAEMRILVNANADWAGSVVNSSMGLDNITALGANQSPVAEAGLPQFVSDSDEDGSEDVTLDGSQSSDPDGQIVSYEWQEDGQTIAMGSNPTVSLARGVHVITLIVTDDRGASAEDTVTITVGFFAVSDLREVPNFGGSGANEAAILKVDQVSGTQDETIAVQINDASSGALINEVSYLNPDFGANGITVYPGLAPAGGPGIGVWASRRSDGLSIIQIKDPSTGALIRNVFPLSAAWAVLEVEAVPNVGANGGYGVAALATNNTSGLMIVQLRDASDNSLIRNVFPLGFGWFPISMEIVPDIGGGVPGIAVLAQRTADQLTIVQVRSAADGTLVRNVFPLGFGFTPREMRVIEDASGDNVWDIATRMTRDSDQLEVVQIRDTVGNAFIRNLFPLPMPAWGTQLNSMQPINNAGGSDISVLSVRLSDGQTLAQVRNSGNGSLTNNTFLIGPPWVPGITYRAFADFSGNNVSEVAVLMQNSQTSAHLLQIRDAADGSVLRNISITN